MIKEVGAHSPRIGGGTDLASTGQASELLLQAKGPWQSDIGRIYARMTRRMHLAVSELMHKARGAADATSRSCFRPSRKQREPREQRRERAHARIRWGRARRGSVRD